MVKETLVASSQETSIAITGGVQMDAIWGSWSMSSSGEFL